MNEYFTHDYNARNDIKLRRLFMDQGLKGIGLYWCIVEMLYSNKGYIEAKDIPTIAYDLRIEEQDIYSLIDNYGLFNRDISDRIYSSSILKRLNIREEKSEKARASANARWGKDIAENTTFMQTQSECNANALQTQCECNAIKENKRKENIITTTINNNKINKIKNNNACAYTHVCEGEIINEPVTEEVLDYFIFLNKSRNGIIEESVLADQSEKFLCYYDDNDWFDSESKIVIKEWKPYAERWYKKLVEYKIARESNGIIS